MQYVIYISSNQHINHLQSQYMLRCNQYVKLRGMCVKVEELGGCVLKGRRMCSCHIGPQTSLI